METTGLPAIVPAKRTIPSPTETTLSPCEAGKSTPRCQAPYWDLGGVNSDIIELGGTPLSGSCQAPTPASAQVTGAAKKGKEQTTVSKAGTVGNFIAAVWA